MPVDREKAALAAAAEWFARLGDEAFDESERQRWRAWLAAAPENAQAWARVEMIAQPFLSLRAKPYPGCSRQALLEARREPRRRALRLLGVGAMALGSLALLGTSLPRSAQWPVLAALMADLRTGVGETRQLALNDGSLLSLNTATRVKVDYDAAYRRIVLYDGEILLDSGVDRRNAPRPLVVDTVHGRVTALGTRFAVLSAGDQTRIDVFAGAVRLTPVSGADTVTIHAGESGRLTARQAVAHGSAAAAREGWAKGLLIADNVTLADFLAELGRYTAVKLEAEPRIGPLRLVGVYRIGNPVRDLPAILAALASSLPLRVEMAGDDHVRLIAN